ncbi:MAG TPA: FlgD immunoglobulin-like domain containing protein [Candidatus Latescibacteria bacterium]|nr:FlgD immunoglobulin-like domain containing protein [Candidatus Latescibacterota bacterium]HOS64013.1 FlgD immunoglobulin-like domain containing protein [Candidatus Latescibacterota bacterium]HPK74868.1 FlgD immunoglobulin-like domain containing protein [Candidatus Latescibacterota bacterium]
MAARHRFLLFAALVFLCAPLRRATGVSGTPVSGEIQTTTWTKAGSPYRVTNTIRVPQGQILTIEPGVDVLFDDDVPFVVEGRIHAVGMQTDSIRFLRGSTEWGGLRISGGDTSTLAYVRISGGNANGNPDSLWNRGGGLFVNVARVGVSHSVISGNSAAMRGGGLYITDPASHVTLTNCCITDNATSPGSSNHGGGAYIYGSTVLLKHTLIAGNSAGGEGGGLYVFGQSAVNVTQCTLVDNNAGEVRTGAIGCGNGAEITLNSNIVWNSGGIPAPDTCHVTYTAIEPGYPGEGNAAADPLFVNAAAGDYRLGSGSPCINTADPALPADPDGTRADMGAYAYVNPSAELILPQVIAHAGTTVPFPITARVADAFGADMAFLLDAGLVESIRVISTAWGETDTTSLAVSGDTVRVSISSAEKRTIVNDVLAELSITLRMDAAVCTVPVMWVPELTDVNEEPATLRDGSLEIRALLYGDVTGDGSLTGLDAAEMLKYRVRLRPTINLTLADVTGNGDVSHLDAALVLYKILHPEYVFPVLGGFVPRPSRGEPRELFFQRDGRSWALMVDDGAGIRGGELAIRSSGLRTVTAPEGLVFANLTDGLFAIAFARGNGSGTLLLRMETVDGIAPEIVTASLDEGAIPVVWRGAGAALLLAPNSPNPFNPSTTITFSLPEPGNARLEIYSADGRLVRVLMNGASEAVVHRVTWDGRDTEGRDAASGIYLCRLTCRSETLVRRMVLVR